MENKPIPAAYFCNTAAPGELPRLEQVAEEFKNDADVFPLYAQAPAADAGRLIARLIYALRSMGADDNLPARAAAFLWANGYTFGPLHAEQMIHDDIAAGYAAACTKNDISGDGKK